MAKLKKYLSRIYFAVLVMVLLLSCSSTKPVIIEREIPVPIPAYRDTTIVLRDTVTVLDSAWYGEVTDSLGKVIGDLTVYFKKKIASINIRRDTLYVLVKDTIPNTTNLNPIIPIISDNLSWWEKTILYSGLGAILSLLIYMRVKRGKLI